MKRIYLSIIALLAISILNANELISPNGEIYSL